ncbi:MAG: hypothetical protein A3F83_11445 [Candidatus Glassbacteria bacterium RIFCSPLOWO2_12_FULL_58_11]|uniref:Guanylate cyclase domain-containing protein n=1 Tax=Candidatus Glassbacteria bacterium RIFCSPLOWO2_12_FULL_58_11 TaxID=1817867 RepID=A0A1F5YZM9_9BACT|nr:MAG: hypothetical protein A3F83_11445 [Candidatus Glassbacteria bacterium RIFCSPLOWO2_12_FULL_58_11]
MFSDIAGFTAIMARDEQKALEALQKTRDTLKPLIEYYNGEWLKEMGDGALSCFESAVEAVNCALEVQRALKDEADFKLRIGIHLGDVVFTGGDVFGDGVNVASRIYPLAEPGGICISEEVHHNIRNQPGIEAKFLGEKQLKNIDHSVMVYALDLGSLAEAALSPYPVKPSAPSKARPSIAVMPFVNMSQDPEQEYFCDGLTEEIINVLTQVDDLRVVARTSSFVFKGRNEDIREIGRRLNVETLLEGSIRKSGTRRRITAQLIKVEDGCHLWSERFDRELEDVFAVQDEIALAIVRELKVRLLKGEKARLTRRRTDNLEAYNLYLKGLYYLRTLNAAGYVKAVEFFSQALEKDQNYALAYDGLGRVNISRSYWLNAVPAEAFPEAREFTKKALELDSGLGEAHASLGFISAIYYWNWKLAEREFNLAVSLNPNSPHSHIYYSFYLTVLGRHEEAVREARRAQELDPLSGFINTHLSTALIYARRYDEAIEELRMSLAMSPGYFLTHLHLGMAYRAKELLQEAEAELERALELSGGNAWVTVNLATMYCQAGKAELADKLFRELKKRSKSEYVPPMCFYLYHLARGDLEQALTWLERAIRERDNFVLWGILSPEKSFQLPEDPRFRALVAEIGLERL